MKEKICDSLASKPQNSKTHKNFVFSNLIWNRAGHAVYLNMYIFYEIKCLFIILIANKAQNWVISNCNGYNFKLIWKYLEIFCAVIILTIWALFINLKD